MASKVRSKATVARNTESDKQIQRYLIALPLIAFLVKLIVMSNVQAGAWYGADGENYMSGVNGFLTGGFFSTESILNYWPSGYPMLIWVLAKISIPNVFYLLSVVQSLFFAYSTFYFSKQLTKTKFSNLAILASLLISFNPTLSLGSLAVGYETPIAACLMMAIGIIIKQHRDLESKFSLKAVCFSAAWFGLAILMQPRFLLIGALVMCLWAIKAGSKRSAALLLALSLGIMAITPGIMIFRNNKAIGQATISTNLGVTMAIGAGDETKGGYQRSGPEVPCEPTPPATTTTDNQKVKCVLQWYIKNPLKTLELSYYKSQFFWSPWSGPLVNGTMARNPWLKIAPTQQIAKNTDGNKLVYGMIGKLISYGWIFGQILLLFVGYRYLRRLGESEKFYANLVLLPIVLSWAISIGTIGDHRFRVPTMAFSLLLQGAGLIAIKKKVFKVL
jgi:hypothetical protein